REARVDRGIGFGPCRRYDDALAGCEPIRLHDHRQRMRVEIATRRMRVAEAPVGTRRNARFAAEILRVPFGALKLASGPRGTEMLDADRLERIAEPGDQRRLRPDDDEVDPLVLHEAQNRSVVCGIE